MNEGKRVLIKYFLIVVIVVLTFIIVINFAYAISNKLTNANSENIITSFDYNFNNI